MSSYSAMLLEDQDAQDYLNYNEDVIIEATSLLFDFVDVIKEAVMNDPYEFIIPGDREGTMDNISAFTESAIYTLANHLSELIAE